MLPEINATYVNGIIKPDQPLQFADHERIVITAKSKADIVKESYGVVRWNGSQEELDELTDGEDNSAWEKS